MGKNTNQLRGRVCLSAAGLTLLLAAAAHAQTIRVEIRGPGNAPAQVREYESGQPISDLPLLRGSTMRINIFSVGGLGVIGRVTLGNAGNPGTTGEPDIELVLGEGPWADMNSPPAATDFMGLDGDIAAVARVRLSGALAGDLLGSVVVGRVGSLRVAGNIAAPLTARGGGEAIGRVWAGRIEPQPGPPDAGMWPPRIAAPYGAIGTITADAAINLGQEGGIRARDGIGMVSAASITGDVEANAWDGHGDLTGLRCVQGDFTGDILANNLRSPEGGMTSTVIHLAGVMRGDVRLTGDFFGGMSVDGNDPNGGGSIRSVKVGGNYAGVIDAPGDIANISVQQNIILDTNSFVEPIIRSRAGTLLNVEIGGSVESIPGVWPLIQASEILALAIMGDFTAQITRFQSGPVDIKYLYIGGSLRGEIDLGYHESVVIRGDIAQGAFLRKSGPFPANRTIRIGDALRGVVFIQDPEEFHGQIITNAALRAGGGWPGTGLVALRNDDGTFTSYTAATYETLRGPFGAGGSVGVVPFDTRRSESVPRASATVARVEERLWPTDGTLREVIVISMTGPVVASGLNAIQVHRTDFSTTCPGGACTPVYLDVSKGIDTIVGPPGHPREIWVSPKPLGNMAGTFGRGWVYRLRPLVIDGVSVVRCAQTFLPEPPPAVIFTHQVLVHAFDLNRDGNTDPLDIMTWLEEPLDLNADGAADDEDLGMVLQAVFGKEDR